MDAKHFEPVVIAHQRAVFAVAYGVTGDRALAEEICQDAFVVAWEKLAAGERIEDLRAWLCGIARNLARNARRRVRPTDALSEALVATELSPLDDTLAKEDSRVVTEALSGLPETLREPIVLYHFLDHSIDEVALTLAISTDNARQRLHRARQALRADLAPRFDAALERARPSHKAITVAILVAIASRASAAPASPLASLSFTIGATVAGAAIAVTILTLSVLHAPVAAIQAAEASTSRPRAVETAAPSSTPTHRRALASDVTTRIPSAPTAAWSTDADRRFTINLNQADFKEVLKLFSDATQVPIVLVDPIDARVNVIANDRPALECIDEVLAQAGAHRVDAIIDGKLGWQILADELQ